MLVGIDTSPCVFSQRNRSMFSSKMTSKYFALQKCLYKNQFFHWFFSLLSIRILVVGINCGYFPAICRVCLLFFIFVKRFFFIFVEIFVKKIYFLILSFESFSNRSWGRNFIRCFFSFLSVNFLM